jgi:imidazolonepropionase-like amidohydrolase
VIVGGKEAWRLATELSDQRIPVILDRTQQRPFRDDDDTDISFKQPALLHEAGVKFAFGYGYGNWGNRSLPFQGAQAVAYGLDQDVALRSLTLTTAEILGVDDQIGSLEVGKDATIVISEGDIMDPTTQDVIRAWIRGREVDLDNKQRELYRKYRAKAYPTEE